MFPKPTPRVREPKRIRRRVTLGAKRAAVKALSTVDEFQRQCMFDDTGNRCGYCAVNPAREFDHIVPIAKGGKDEPSNLLPSCIPCNRAKGTQTWRPFLRHRFLEA